MTDKINVIVNVAKSLVDGQLDTASDILNTGYPFAPISKQRLSLSQPRMMKVFIRDKFTDRYSGQRLIFPGALSIISVRLPDTFPVHSNWKVAQTHMAYYDLWPSIDHVIPVGRGGSNDDDNLVTTSYLRNLAKSMWTLEELNWEVQPVPVDSNWDGLTGWFMQMVDADAGLLDNSSIRNWHAAAKKLHVTG